MSDRQRRYRQRQGKREAVYRIPVGEGVLWALMARGLSEDDARDRVKVERELSEVLAAWAKHWT